MQDSKNLKNLKNLPPSFTLLVVVPTGGFVVVSSHKFQFFDQVRSGLVTRADENALKVRGQVNIARITEAAIEQFIGEGVYAVSATSAACL